MRYEKVTIQTNQTTAELTLFLMDNYAEVDANRIRPTILICPGGGYAGLSNREAEPIAIQMTALGFHAAVLRYHVAPFRFPVALAETACAVAHLRSHAAKYGVDPEKIVVAGFSAGGHLAASLGVFWDKEWLTEYTGCTAEEIKPNGLILSYPVITSGEKAHRGSIHNLLGENASVEQMEQVSLEKQVTSAVPPTFIWHTVGDQLVPVENSLLFTSALQNSSVKYEMHIYPQGIHGLALSTDETACHFDKKYSPDLWIQPECAAWVHMAGRFVKEEI